MTCECVPKIMTESTIKDIVITFTAISSIIQSLIWMAMTITGLLAHSCLVPATSVDNDVLSTVMHYMYFREKDCEPILDPKLMPNIKNLRSPEDVYICMFVYLFVSLFWFIASLLILISKNRFKRFKKIFDTTWIVISTIVCLMDFILAILFGLDYGKIHKLQILNTIYPGKLLAMQTAAGLMMAMSMRGFILWILNVSCTVYMAISLKKSRENVTPKKHMQGNTWLYDNVSIHEDEYGERKLKGLPKTELSLGAWAPLHELLKRYKIHTPKIRNKTPVPESNEKYNDGYLSEIPIQFINPSVPIKTDMYQDPSMY